MSVHVCSYIHRSKTIYSGIIGIDINDYYQYLYYLSEQKKKLVCLLMLNCSYKISWYMFFFFLRERNRKICSNALNTAISQIFHFVNSYKPMLSGVCLFQHIQFEVLVADLSGTYTIVAGWLTTFRVNLYIGFIY